MRYELTDFEWAAIRSFLPNKPRGIPRVDDRRVLNSIFWVLRSGAPWRDLPQGFDFAIVADGLCAANTGNSTIQRSYLTFACDRLGAVCRPGAGQKGFQRGDVEPRQFGRSWIGQRGHDFPLSV